MSKRREYDRSDIMKMQAALKALPKKKREKERLSVPDVVKSMRGEIRAALARGYTLDEIITALNNQGDFDLKAPTIKRYLSSTVKKRTVSAISGRFMEKKVDNIEPKKKSFSSAVDLPSAAEL